MKGFKHSFFVSVSSLFITLVWASSPKIVSLPLLESFSSLSSNPKSLIQSPLANGAESGIVPLAGDTPVKLKYPMQDQSTGMPALNDYNGGLYLNDPSNIKTDIIYDTDSGVYNVNQKMGTLDYRPPIYMTQEEYMDYQFKKSMKSYWKERSTAESMTQKKNKSNLIPPIKINNQVFDRIFGSNIVDIRPQGSAELIFGVNSSHTENPAIPVKQRRITTFDFNEKIQLSLVGKIGDKMKITTNYNTEATFDFENKMKLEWSGGEDDIIKKIEAGNVSLPLNSTLISGSQSLFGIKTQLQFGKTTITSVISQEKGQKKEINIENGAQTNSFVINGDAYEANKHFFVAQYFKDRYDSALSHLPVIESGVNISKMEVWITNTSSNTNDTRNIIALTDLGENNASEFTNPTSVFYQANNGVPDNTANTLNPKILLAGANDSIRNKDKAVAILTAPPLNLRAVQDFEKVLSARRLSPSEFTFNPKLGFVSLNTNINPDQVVAVAFQYTYNGGTYQVGELSTDGIADPKCLLVKLLKSTNVSPKRDPFLWELMMKNVYAMGAYQIKPDNFKLDIYYTNPATGTDIPVIPETNLQITGKPLLQVMNLDRINTSGDPVSDGVFDFIDGVTVSAANGRVYFPVREPFGDHLRAKINPSMSITSPLNIIAEKYVYDQLYDSTKYGAQQFPEKNRFRMKGSFKSASGSEINLNAPNIPEHSVIVTAGGVPLTENVDYTVDYALGKVKIINDGILKSGTPIKISFESNVMFGFQQKTLLGTHVDYRVNKDFHLGGTALHLTERPLMQKVNIGDEPISNTVLGMDGNYRSEFPFLTRLVDKLPFYSTKEMSTITATGEVAYLIPGVSRAIGKNGTSYIDDFEGSQTPIDIKAVGAWNLASTPQGVNPLWLEGSRTDTVYGFNRAKLAWYTIDPMFMRQTANLTPSYFTKAQQSDNYSREILETEIFPKKESSTGQPVPMQTLDLAYYPSERGPYNYDAEGVLGVSAGTDPATGNLKSPSSRWGGIMRRIETNDFEAANVQFVQIWMMDPFNSDLGSPYNNLQLTSGELVVQLGNVSEDVCRDGKKSFENGLPTTAAEAADPNNPNHPYANTSWGRVPTIQAIVNAFDNDLNTRTAQDVGLDGLNNADEAIYFSKFLTKLGGVSSTAQAAASSDPSSDNYHYYRGDDYDAAQLGTLARYKNFNGLEGNSPVSTGAYPTSSTTVPSTEDINRDNNLSENEGYFQYRVKISPQDFNGTTGNNYITDVVSGGGTTLDNTAVDTKWYQLKIPVLEFESKFGNIEDFKSIRFMRMILRGFSKPIVLRMARLELIRGEWRKYQYDLAADGEYSGNDNSGTSFDVSAVNYQENGTKTPVDYVLPPNIEQQLSYGSATPVHLNEQAMALKVCNLQDGDARATYKNVDFDLRSYKKLRMYVHAEAQVGSPPVHDGDVTCFVRLGSDYTQNYYEYEIPLRITPPGSYDNNSTDAREQVWKPANDMELSFSDLQALKQARDKDIFTGKASLAKPYHQTLSYIDSKGNTQTRYVYVKGNPTFSALKTIMIGVRNPHKGGTDPNPSPDDDGLSKCVEVWVNELRLTDFDEQGGGASTAHVTAKLADLGTVSLSGNYSTPGWGSIDKKVSERQRDTRYQYDLSAQILLSKFLPTKWGIMLPMYIGYSNAIIKPQYDPLSPDIYLKDALNNLPNDSLKKDLIARTIDKTTRKSINFTNVKKERPKNSKRNNIYDIENFAFNFSFTEFQNHGAQVQFNNIRDYRSGLIYGYSTNPKSIQPFKNVKLFDKKVFTLIKDFNFSPYPNKYAFLLDVDRHYAEQLQRNTTGMEFPMDTFFDKHYNMIRGYDVKYDLAKSLKLDFHADNSSRILEPYGAIDTKAKQDEIKQNLLKGGINTNYTQHSKVDYTVPLAKFPLTDWITANAGYAGDYKWTRALFSADTLGNTIINGNQKTLNLQGNMVNLYNKIPYFKKVNKGIKKDEKKKTPAKPKTVPGKEPPKTTAPITPAPKNPKDTTKKAKKLGDYLLPQYVARTIMMLKNVSVNFTNNAGMMLSGFKDSARYLGMNTVGYQTPFGHMGGLPFGAPGAGFVFGQQNNFGAKKDSFTDYAAKQGWLVKATTLNTPYTKTQTQNIAGRATIEPMPGFKIELTANKNKTKNYSEFFRWGRDTLTGNYDYLHQSPTESGNFSMSFITWKTAFEKVNKDFSSNAFNTFLNDREVISQKLAVRDNRTPGSAGNFSQGYGATSQQTMMFAFLSAYSGQDANKSSLQTFPKVPLPNWRVTYDGLSKVKPLKKIFKTITLSHAYRSSMSFAYTNNLDSKLKGSGETPIVTNENNDYIFYEQINSVSIAEQFAPLIKVDMVLQNSWQFNFEIKKDRNIVLSFANNQLTEIDSKEYVVGTGYRWKNLEIKNPFSKNKSKKPIKSDLVLKADFSVRQNLTVIRKVVEGVTQPTAGQTIYSVKTSADYMITQRITARLFYDFLFTNPRISTSFKTSNQNGGISIRFSLS